MAGRGVGGPAAWTGRRAMSGRPWGRCRGGAYRFRNRRGNRVASCAMVTIPGRTPTRLNSFRAAARVQGFPQRIPGLCAGGPLLPFQAIGATPISLRTSA